MNQKDKSECEIVQDLLPLYHDDACSNSSRNLVKTHISSCDECKRISDELNNYIIDEIIMEESSGVLEHHAKKERTEAYKAGVLISALLFFPVFITLIVSMANGEGIGIFLVVLASMLFIGAMTVVPLMSIKNKFVRTIICSVFTLLMIIYFVDSLYGGGDFLLIAIPTVFGISIVFFPFVIRAFHLPVILADKKALITMCWDTVWLYLTIWIVCIKDNAMAELRAGILIASVFVVISWVIFLIARYIPTNRYIKSGLIAIVCGFGICFSYWTSDLSMNTNVYLMTFITSLIIGTFLIIFGLIRRKNNLRLNLQEEKGDTENEE